MYNRWVIGLFMLLGTVLGWWWWHWTWPGGVSLNSGQVVSSSKRLNLDLSGEWIKYPTLRQAWAKEMQGSQKGLLTTPGQVLPLPSNEPFKVAVRRFKIPSEWSARTIQLVMSGVQGRASVYLNGIDQAHQVGVVEGLGGEGVIDIPPAAFRYGQDNDNFLFIETSGRSNAEWLSSFFPQPGMITGQLCLQGVVETTLAIPKISVTWQGEVAKIHLSTRIIHHNLSESGPWTVSAVLSDGSAEIAGQTVTVSADENPIQEVNFTLSVPTVRRWNLQNPFLYQLYMTVTNSKGDQDDLSLSVGLRTVEYVSGKFKLNGEPVTIKGLALSPSMEEQIRHGNVEEWLKEQKSQGINLIYLIGKLPDEIWLSAADRMGMGVWGEFPVEMVPASRLPKVELFQQIIDAGQRHPSFWSWTVGKGLEPVPLVKGYFEKVKAMVNPLPAYLLHIFTKNNNLPPEYSILINKEKLAGTWGEVSLVHNTGTETRWIQESLMAKLWALIMLFFAWMNFRAVSWRYKEINEKKPKRRLRSAWRWHNLFFLGREATLAGILTSAILRIPLADNDWFNPWRGLEVVQNSPWFTWSALTILLILLRLLQVGLAAPYLPASPHPLGLIYWLERRNRWAVVVAILWVGLGYGLSWYVPLLSYLGLSLLFLPLRIRDIHKVGGRYGLFLLVPGFLVIGLLIWGIVHWPDVLYMWHLVRRVV